MTFTKEQVDVLRTLAGVWSDIPFCLVGASALRCYMDLRWRETHDLDISVSVSLGELAAQLDSLPGFERRPGREHEWSAPNGVRVDVLPAGPDLVSAGEIVWPRSGMHMSLVGFRLAFEQRRRAELAPGVAVDVPPFEVIGLLKMVAYLDRPHERERDLQDVAHILEEYLPPEDPRRGDSEAHDAGVGFYHASAFAFGRALASLVDARERTAVETFIRKLRDERDLSNTLTRMARLGPARWRGEEEEALVLVTAFEKGFSTRG